LKFGRTTFTGERVGDGISLALILKNGREAPFKHEGRRTEKHADFPREDSNPRPSELSSSLNVSAVVHWFMYCDNSPVRTLLLLKSF
jgi:hypothetical protein